MIAAGLQEGDVGVVTTGGVTTSYMRNSGTAGTIADYTVIAAPDGQGVTSVNGYSTAAVVLAKADVGLGSVDNTADVAKAVLSATKLATARTIAGVSFAATNVAAAIVESVMDSVRLIMPNFDTQPMRFTGYGTSLPASGMVAGDVFFVTG
jgi:hypothetical protein